MASVLIIRTSSFGDVALLAPVVYSVAARYPQVRFTVMTRQAYSPIFDHLGFNVSVLPLDMRKKHRGILGTISMTLKALKGGFTHVADTHDSLRTKILRVFMHLTFSKVRKIDKGRGEKENMIAKKITAPFLKHATERYMEVFEKLGFPAQFTFHNLYEFKPRNFNQLREVITEKQGTWIGIAPFAQHDGKVYPLDMMEKVVAKLSERRDTTLFLFGSGKTEMRTIEQWTERYPNIVSHHGLLNLDKEILLISYLDAMLCMDSANMHLASLVRVPAVSIWGATHPAIGFYGYEQDVDNIVQRDMDCRPCSIYGSSPCQFTGDDEYKCMKQITNTEIIEKLEKVLADK